MKATMSKKVKRLGVLCVALCMMVSLAVPAFAATETFIATGEHACSTKNDCGLFWSEKQMYDEYWNPNTGDYLYQHAGFGVCC